MRAPKRGVLALAEGVVNYLFYAAPAAPLGPPLVLFGGTAQVLNSMLTHHGPLSKGRALLHYELRGQGTTTTLPCSDCTLERHVADFDAVMSAARGEGLIDDEAVDLCGFSFGGRVALAVAANDAPRQVRKLVATGVPADRGATGRVILRAWLSTLERGDLNSFLWQSMAAGHSEAFLRMNEDRLPAWIDSAAALNRCDAILGLVRDSHTDDESSPWHTLSLARRAAAAGLASCDALFVSGALDRLAQPSECALVAAKGGWRCELVAGAGHAVPAEEPRVWREHVLRFLDS